MKYVLCIILGYGIGVFFTTLFIDLNSVDKYYKDFIPLSNICENSTFDYMDTQFSHIINGEYHYISFPMNETTDKIIFKFTYNCDNGE